MANKSRNNPINWTTVLCVVGSIFAVSVCALGAYVLLNWFEPHGNAPQVSYAEVAAISLGAATVAVACFSLIAGVFLFIGFKEARDLAVQKAVEEARALAQQEIETKQEELEVIADRAKRTDAYMLRGMESASNESLNHEKNE